MSRNGRLGLLGLGTGGLLLGHSLAYLLSFPSGDHRHAVLLITGHGYLPVAAWVAAGFTVAAMFATVARSCGRRGPPARLWTSFGWLAAVQVLGFVVLEAGERVLAGLGPFELAVPVVIGIAVQVLVVLAGALVDVGLERVVGGAMSAIPFLVPKRRVRSSRPATIVPLVRFVRDPNPARGPPALLAA